jgi:hypothetical protein
MRKIIIFFVLLASLLMAEEQLTVKRNRGLVRGGPGSFFPVITVLQQGQEFQALGLENGWYKTLVDSSKGFISEKVTRSRSSQKDIFAQMAGQHVSKEVSRHGMTAGVKGFGERFTKKLKGDSSFVQVYLNYNLVPGSYLNFRRNTYNDFNNQLCLKQNKIPSYEGEVYFTFSETGFGIGIASQIAGLGLYNNSKVQDYLNNIVTLLVEVSENYDNQVKVFILNTDKVNAYACPGGIVFVTKGMLQMVDSEAELACVLAHELAHINRRHGMQELEKRKEHVKSDAVFAEMEAEFEELEVEQPEEIQQVEKELEALAFQIYQKIFEGRLAEYEEEADYIGAIYAARAGYNSREMLKLLERLQKQNSESTNEHYTQEQLKQRYDWLQENLREINLVNSYLENKFRWIKMKALIN